MQKYEENNQPTLLKRKSSRQSSGTRATNAKAYTFAALASICIVLSQISLKKLSNNFQSTLLLALRGSLLFVFNFIYLNISNISFHIQDPKLYRAVVKRASFSAATSLMYLGSVKFLPIGIVNALFNTNPIMTFFVQFAYYKKTQCNWLNLVIIIISFTGVLLIIQPPFLFGGISPDHFIFYFVVLLGALTGAFSFIFLHDLRGKVKQLVVLQHGYLIQAFMNYSLYQLIPHNDSKSINFLNSLTFLESLRQILFILLMVLFAFAAQFLLARSLYLCSPALITPFSYFSVIVGFLIDLIIFNAQYDGFKILGMCMASLGLFSKFAALYIKKQKPKITNFNQSPNQAK